MITLRWFWLQRLLPSAELLSPWSPVEDWVTPVAPDLGLEAIPGYQTEVSPELFQSRGGGGLRHRRSCGGHCTGRQTPVRHSRSHGNRGECGSDLIFHFVQKTGNEAWRPWFLASKRPGHGSFSQQNRRGPGFGRVVGASGQWRRVPDDRPAGI